MESVCVPGKSFKQVVHRNNMRWQRGAMPRSRVATQLYGKSWPMGPATAPWLLRCRCRLPQLRQPQRTRRAATVGVLLRQDALAARLPQSTAVRQLEPRCCSSKRHHKEVRAPREVLQRAPQPHWNGPLRGRCGRRSPRRLRQFRRPALRRTADVSRNFLRPIAVGGPFPAGPLQQRRLAPRVVPRLLHYQPSGREESALPLWLGKKNGCTVTLVLKRCFASLPVFSSSMMAPISERVGNCRIVADSLRVFVREREKKFDLLVLCFLPFVCSSFFRSRPPLLSSISVWITPVEFTFLT